MVRLRMCAGWSEPLHVAHTTLLEISCCGSYIHLPLLSIPVASSETFEILIRAVTNKHTDIQKMMHFNFALDFSAVFIRLYRPIMTIDSIIMLTPAAL